MIKQYKDVLSMNLLRSRCGDEDCRTTVAAHLCYNHVEQPVSPSACHTRVFLNKNFQTFFFKLKGVYVLNTLGVQMSVLELLSIQMTSASAESAFSDLENVPAAPGVTKQ